jgi:hypothetical protein
MSEQPHRPSDQTLTIPEIAKQPDADGGRASVRPLRPAPVRPVEAVRPVEPPVRESADVDIFRPAARDVVPSASERSGASDPSGFGFAGPAHTRTPATGEGRRARTPIRPSRAPHIAVAIAVPAAGIAGFLSAILSTGLPMLIVTYAALGSIVAFKVAGPVRAVAAFLAAVIAKIGPR